MDRRGFLGFFGAAAAALTVAKSAVGLPAPKAAAIRAARVSACTSGYQKNLDETERMVRDYIAQCRVVSCEAILSATQPQQLRVVYSDGAVPSVMDAEVAKATANARIRDCTVSQTVSGRNDIEVTWLLVP